MRHLFILSLPRLRWLRSRSSVRGVLRSRRLSRPPTPSIIAHPPRRQSRTRVSSHPVQGRCTALTLFYLLIRTSRLSPGLQSNVSEESSPLPDTLAFTAVLFLFINPHFQTVTGASEKCVRQESPSPLGSGGNSRWS